MIDHLVNFSLNISAKIVNVSRQTINAMELGKYVPSTVLAMKVAHIFGVKVNDIFTLEDSDWE